MIYNLRYNNLLGSKDGSLENIQDNVEKYDIINYYYILLKLGNCFMKVRNTKLLNLVCCSKRIL